MHLPEQPHAIRVQTMSFLLSMFSGLFIVLGGIKTVQPLGTLFLVLLI